jgi:uncharacterized GH25 family protein
MHTTMRIARPIAFIAALGLPFVAQSRAFAHDAWAIMKDFAVKPSGQATVQPISSHVFVVPGKDFMAQDKVASAALVSPDGTEQAATATADGYASGDLKAKGTYLAVVKQQPGFYSSTPDGGVPKNKKDAPGAVNCRYSEKHAKALFTVGASGGDGYAKVLGLPMEIVPLQDPSTLKAGAMFEVKVLFDGKPAGSTVVYGTYAGFSDVPGTFAYTTSTNKEGIAKIKLLKKGVWLLLTKRDEPYKDASVCDKQAYSGALTFQVKN